MNIESLRIVYMGTPDFAVGPLEKLLGNGLNVVAVVTAPDKPAGRGKKIRFPALKQYLLKHSGEIPILQPENLKDPEFVKKLESLKPDIQVVVAFRMLPEVVWRIPGKGTFNLHASLLPLYRGAAPINHVILNGEKETGVTTFLIDEQIDTGNILLQRKTAIGERESAGELHDRLMSMGSDLVLETIRGLADGALKPIPQDQFISPPDGLKKAPKIYRQDCRIIWEAEGIRIFNLIRGLSPHPGAFTFLNREGAVPLRCKILASSFRKASGQGVPGTIQTDGKKFLEVAVSDGFISVLTIQPEGKRSMKISEYLAGTRLVTGLYRFS